VICSHWYETDFQGTKTKTEAKLASLAQKERDFSQDHGGCWLPGADTSRLDQEGMSGGVKISANQRKVEGNLRMSYDMQVLNWRGNSSRLSINTDPDSCPICHRAIQPVDQKWDFLIDEGAKRIVERVLRCPKKDCLHLFIARYNVTTGNPNMFLLDACVPAEVSDYAFAPELHTISPDFCNIYNQAQKAEQLQLTLVCGPGYRKALEFLVKDYVSLLHPAPEDKVKIEKMTLMACIKEYVADPKVKTMAERAAWLGNDETHYVRKWED
jgi:hypothetical protein